jgi:TolB-like protein/class 3 adenylate cyclase/Tfp pilus assembly protein PilF
LSTEQSGSEPDDLRLEIAHLLLIDVVGYSKLLVNEQIEVLQQLNQIVRGTESFRAAETSGRLVRVPTGDGMALIFFRTPEEPAQCALEIARALQEHPHIQLRMGVHSGPVHHTTDVNDRSNVAGAGINVAQRIMDCGDAGHILLSGHVADDLTHYRHWQPYLHDLGECEVKHGLRLHVFNLCKDGLGNPAVPERLRRARRWKKGGASIRPIGAPPWSKFALVAALLLSAVALSISFFIFFRRAAPMITGGLSQITAAISEKSIAVLPFDNLSEEKGNAYFTDGVQDEILTDLAKVADLKVISRTSVMQYKSGAERNLRDIAKALGVAHVLEGTVQRAGERVRVSAQLIDARTDTHLWAEHYDRELADVFRIQSEIAEKIVSQLKAKLSPREKAAIEEKPTNDLAAYDLYLRAKDLVDALAFIASGTENLLEATRLLDSAIARDPSFLLAYCHLARAHDIIYFLGFDHTPARLALADAAVKAALRLRSDSGEAHLALAQHLYWGSRDYERARQELAIARRALPNEPLALVLSGYIDRRQNRWGDSTQELERALELDPRNLFILQQISYCYEYLRRFKDMAAVLDRVVSINPNDVNTRAQRAYVDLAWRADVQPLHAAIESIITQDAKAASTISDRWILLALCERDSSAAERAVAVMQADACYDQGIPFPHAWCEGVVSRQRGDNAAAHNAFTRARAEVEEMLRKEPNYAEAYCVLGMIDAALGKKEEAVREGQHAVELLPIAKDALNGALLIEYFAITCAWANEKELALEQLAYAARIPSNVSYGHLRLHPYWDPLRGDPRFEKIVASLAPEATKP